MINKKFFKNFTKLVTTFVFVTSSFFIMHMLSNSVAQNLSEEELEELKKEKDDLQKSIDSLKEQKDQVVNEIEKEKNNQQQLQQETTTIEQRINESEYIIRDLELDLERINLDLQIVTKEKQQVQQELDTVNAEITDLEETLISYNNFLLKANFKSFSFLDENSSLEANFIDSEKIKTIVKLTEQSVVEARVLKKEVQSKHAEIERQEQELNELLAEKEASTNQLEQQKVALEVQKNNKNVQLNQSEQKEQDLEVREDEIKNEISQYQVKLNSILNALFLAPPQGTRVEAGQVIGFQGRTGLSCNPIEDGIARTNTYCQDLAGLSSYWYYYDPVQYPTKGSHLHFSYFKNGAEIDPYTYIWGGNETEFSSKPMDSAFLTQGFHGGHRAIDMVAYHGAPVYAVNGGVVRYYCDGYGWLPPEFPDPGYGAIVYHDDGTRTAYWHLQKRADSPRGENCTF